MPNALRTPRSARPLLLRNHRRQRHRRRCRASMIAATAERPTMQEPESAFSQPNGPTNPPRVAALLMKESPPNGGWPLPKQASTNPNGLTHPNGLLQKAPPMVNGQVLSWLRCASLVQHNMAPNGPSTPPPPKSWGRFPARNSGMVVGEASPSQCNPAPQRDSLDRHCSHGGCLHAVNSLAHIGGDKPQQCDGGCRLQRGVTG
jgi:hypothetical protein